MKSLYKLKFSYLKNKYLNKELTELDKRLLKNFYLKTYDLFDFNSKSILAKNKNLKYMV